MIAAVEAAIRPLLRARVHHVGIARADGDGVDLALDGQTAAQLLPARVAEAPAE
jgi:hypothetical protein